MYKKPNKFNIQSKLECNILMESAMIRFPAPRAVYAARISYKRLECIDCIPIGVSIAISDRY